jgi:hypothetical protein
MPTPISRALGLLCATLALALAAAPAHAADAQFTTRYATTVRGDVAAVGNTLLTCPGSCAAIQSSTTANDNDSVMTNVNVDNDGTNFDSSSATVTLPAGSTVLWAGLYWAADVSAGVSGAVAPTAANKGTVRFRGPSGGYHTVTAAPADVLTSSLQASRYRAFADVTSLVTAGGTYTVGNVQAGTGKDRFAGWALLVAYRNSNQPIRRLTVFDGLGTVQNGTSFSTTIAPFHTPATGTVTTKAGLLTFEGDAGLATETATFNGHALTDALNPVNNAMNSTIESGGVRFTAKNPDYVNQLGMDLDVFTDGGQLANDQSAATLAFSSTNEYFMPSAFFLVSDEGPATSTGGGPTIAPPAGGVAHDGESLSADPGTWNGTGTLTYGYQWQQCDANGANCHDIAGATSSTYTPNASNVGGTVRVVVTATNDAGTSAPTVSAPIAIKASSAPVNTSPPVLGGGGQAATQGQALSVDPGSWNGPGTSYTYTWQRCDANGANCTNIPGANDANYTPTANDVGHTLRAVVVGTNDAGTSTKTTAPSAIVTAAPDPSDLSGVPGNLVGEASCQQLVGGAKYRRVALTGIGTVRVRAYTSGPALRSSPLRLTTEVTGGRAKSVRYLFDGRAVGATRGKLYPATLTPSQIGKVGLHTLKTSVRGRRGTKTVSLKLTTQPCQTLFTAQRWRTTAGAGLRLRIDSRTALRRLSFAVPAALLPTQNDARRSAGFIRLYIAGRTRPVRYPLTLPKRGARAIMLASTGRATVTRTATGLRVTGLPARAAVAEVTLYRVTKLDHATSPRAYTVKATVQREQARTQTFRAKPKAPR